VADPESTHHAECWRDHHACAVAEVERLAEALEDKPPPADAVLLAKANRMLHERCEALESEVERLRAAILSRGSVRPPGLVMTRETTMEWEDEWLRTGGAGQDNKQRGGEE